MNVPLKIIFSVSCGPADPFYKFDQHDPILPTCASSAVMRPYIYRGIVILDSCFMDGPLKW